MNQHASLSPERWGQFTLDQQIIMIGNEMHRGSKLLGIGDGERRKSAYARILALADLTVRVTTKHGLRRELLRWRDLVARLYIVGHGEPEAHASALRVLLQFTPEAARQISHVAGDRVLDRE
ncbi:MAG: hypothetical protein AAB011_06865 [Candidatus Eisenbacteria bacterium]